MAPIALTPPALTNGAHDPSDYMTAGASPLSPSMSPNEGLRLPKFGSLRESMTRTTSIIRPKFGRSTSVAFEGHASAHEYLKTLKSTRFRYMPANGSNWDRVLKWADNIGGIVLLSNGILSEFMLNSEDASRMVCGSCTSLLQVSAHLPSTHFSAALCFYRVPFFISLRRRPNIKLTFQSLGLAT
jgi:hypothetical protein